jgi:hypothetical protein
MLEPMIELLVNSNLSDYELSDKALNMYNQIMFQKDSDFKPIGTIELRCLDRSNPILLQIFHDIGSKKMSGIYCSLDIVNMPEKYKNYYSIIDTEDRSEFFIVNHEKYIVGEFKKILDSNLSDNEKIIRLERINVKYQKCGSGYTICN